MSVRRGVARGVAVLSAGQGGAQALQMVKNVLVARLLGPDEWGVVATFWVTLTLLDSITTLAADRQVVQAEDGAEKGFLGTAHALQALRGLGTGCVLFGLSWVAAWAFKTPQALWAYQAIAIVPVIRGLSHLGVFVAQREMRFGPTVWAELWSQGVALVVGVVLAWQLGTFAAALWMIMAQTVAWTALTHVWGGSRYGWGWDSGSARRIALFCVPLMLNGALMFIVFQGDQTVIGVAYDKATLGLYAAAFMLASTPTQLVAKVASSAFLPPLSRAQGDPVVFERRVRGSVEALALLGGAAGVGLAALGPWVMRTFFGAEYAAAGAVVGLLGVMFAIRIVRIGPTLAAMARGDTMNSAVGNMWRCAALVGVIVAAWQRADVWWIALAGVLGEGMALVASCVRLRARQGVGLRASMWASSLAVGVMCAALVVERAIGGLGLAGGIVFGAVAYMALIGAMLVWCPGVASEARALWARVRRVDGGAAENGASA